MNKEKWIYVLIRIGSLPLAWMPLSIIRFLGNIAGICAYLFMHKWRKRVLSNLALANAMALTPKQIIQLAKQSFKNLSINCLEYPKFASKKDLTKMIQCENPEEAFALYQQGKGIIFFCGHQANWEALFLEGTQRMQGVAIGKTLKNPYLDKWVQSMRTKYGGTIIQPRNAVQKGFRALKKGIFLGIVGDQGMPDSDYAFPFLGRRAWTSTAPALLAYKTNSPIIVATTKRVKKGYRIHYSQPIWPNSQESLEKEIPRLMHQTLTQFEQSVLRTPGEWLWQHNRWKQQTPRNLYYRFRHDCILIIFPALGLDEYMAHLQTFRTIYDKAFITLALPHKPVVPLPVDEVWHYTQQQDLLKSDFRFKLVFNFTIHEKIGKHYKSLSALEVLDMSLIKESAKEHLLPHHNFSDILLRALCRPNSLWQKEQHAG